MATSSGSEQVSRSLPVRLELAEEFVASLPNGALKEVLGHVRLKTIVDLSFSNEHLKDNPRDPRCPQGNVDVAFAVQVAYNVLKYCDVRLRPRMDDDWSAPRGDEGSKPEGK